jgi:hypothetical protein
MENNLEHALSELNSEDIELLLDKTFRIEEKKKYYVITGDECRDISNACPLTLDRYLTAVNYVLNTINPESHDYLTRNSFVKFQRYKLILQDELDRRRSNGN